MFLKLLLAVLIMMGGMYVIEKRIIFLSQEISVSL